MSDLEINPDTGRLDLTRIAGTCAALSVRRASRAVTQFYDNALAPIGIGIAQLGVLTAIEMHDGATTTEIAKQLVVDRTTLVRNLQLLERDGLIETMEGEDRRTRSLSVTSKGREMLKAAYPRWVEAQEQLIKTVGGDEWTVVRTGLRSLEQLYDG